MTFILHQNSGNTIALSLEEKSHLSSPNWLFRIINDDSKKEKLFIGIDLTGETRYELFNITLTGSSSNEELSAGTINITPNGWWKYEIYEQTSNINLQISGTTGRIIEQGKLYVSGSTRIAEIIEYEGDSQTHIFYEG